MKILFITPSYFPHRGGTEQVIYEMCRILSKNHEITILTQKRSKRWKSVENINNITVHRIRPLPHYLGNLLHFELKQFQLLNKAAQLHKKCNFDLIHSFHVFEFSKAIIKIKNKLKLPLVTSLMGWDTFSPIKKIPNNKLHLVTRVLNHSNAITSPSSHMAQVAKNDQGCTTDITIIPHGTRLSNSSCNSTEDIHSFFNIPSNRRIFLSVQRLHKAKGLSYLIDAIPMIIKKHPDSHFLIAGTGPEKDNLVELAIKNNVTDYITWAGFQDKLLPDLYKSSDFFLLPSLYESFGLVYVEALAFGLPVISTFNAGTSDIVNSSNGVLFHKESPSEIVTAVNKAIDMKWNKDEIAINAQCYHWNQIVPLYEKLYSQCLQLENGK